ncbi:MAG: PDZ domain-containing protein [Flavobacteriales bacterium]|nr:PDZ domain-containing protein [Flavobacteriales bacterium]
MKYKISYNNPNQQYIEIEFYTTTINTDETLVRLPAWRPGRYEMGNFAKNIQKWSAFDEKGKTLNFEKISKECWKVDTKNTKRLVIKYNYYAAELNAGSSFIDENQLYVNPINCLLYIDEFIDSPCELKLEIPKNFQIATSLQKKSKNSFVAVDFHELVDSPIIASIELKHHEFKVKNTLFHIWLNGECKPDFRKLETDFSKFCSTQITSFGEFPVKEYHFLIQILPFKAYHGVEHCKSTVITIGPGYDVFTNKDWYDEFLGISSHELYHTWNVKQIRPLEMLPYNYSKENYSNLGYIYEGITTYMGDKMLLTSGVFDFQQYAKTFNELLFKHYHNTGRLNYSVEQSSFDTWIDGYTKGVPGRKTSIYTEGALIAFITDVFILKNTKNKKSLNDVMKLLYTTFAKKDKGITGDDYKRAVEQIARKSYNKIFNSIIQGKEDFTPYIVDGLNYLGYKLSVKPSKHYNESYLGLKVKYENGKCLIDNIYPNSPAEKSGISINDEIIAINKFKVNNDFEHWCSYFNKEEQTLSIKKELGILKNITLQGDKTLFFKDYSIEISQKKKVKK